MLGSVRDKFLFKFEYLHESKNKIEILRTHHSLGPIEEYDEKMEVKNLVTLSL